MTKLAQLISRMEGFGIPGAIPTLRHNPGDLEHAPDESHPDDNPVGEFVDDETGWAMLERQLQLDASRGWTLEQLVNTYAPPPQNNPTQYLNFLCAGLGLPGTATVAQALEIPDAS